MSQIELKGNYYIRLYGPDGTLKKEVSGENVVTTVGKEFIASFLKSAALAAATFTAKYIAIGSDATGEAVGNTALGTELARQTATATYTSGGIYELTATFATGTGTGSIYEYGLLSSSTAGTLLSRDTEALITKGANDSLAVTYQLTFS